MHLSAVNVWIQPGRPPAQPRRLLATGECREVVEFSGNTPKVKIKTVILDTPVLADVFVYRP